MEEKTRSGRIVRPPKQPTVQQDLETSSDDETYVPSERSSDDDDESLDEEDSFYTDSD